MNEQAVGHYLPTNHYLWNGSFKMSCMNWILLDLRRTEENCQRIGDCSLDKCQGYFLEGRLNYMLSVPKDCKGLPALTYS